MSGNSASSPGGHRGHDCRLGLNDNAWVVQVTTRTGHYLAATWVDGQALQLANQMRTEGIPYKASNPQGGSLLSLILGWLPFIVILLLFFVVLGQVRGWRRQGSWWLRGEASVNLNRAEDGNGQAEDAAR
jgi:ATP-dependent Zn protease